MDGIDWASSAMVAARTRLNIATANLANASTDGFRSVVARGRLTAHGAQVIGETSNHHGGLRRTGRDFDLAIVGSGSFRVRDAHGTLHSTRDGAFERDCNGFLRDAKSRVLIGAGGPVRVPDGATVEMNGSIVLGGRQLNCIDLPPGSSVHSGYLESSGVDAIGEMVGILTAQRSFESAQKVVTSIDGVRQKVANDVARLK